MFGVCCTDLNLYFAVPRTQILKERKNYVFFASLLSRFGVRKIEVIFTKSQSMINLTLLTYSSDLISGYIQEVGNRYNYFFYLYNYFLRDSFCSLPYSISLFCFVFSSLYYSLHWFLYIPLFFLKTLNKHTTFINYMEPGRCYNFLISLLFIIINILF